MKTDLKVELLSHTPEPEKVVAYAAKLCYSDSDIDSLINNLTDEKIKSFINILSSYGHESPFEHISFTFGIEGVSRSLTHQLVRHRIGSSYSQKSQRYVVEGDFNYIIPPHIEEDEEAKEIFINSMKRVQSEYDKLTHILYKRHLDSYLSDGMDIKSAENIASKKAIEDARFVLPNACETKIIVTMNARALFNFFHHRCCNRAQWEIRACAERMLFLVREVAPNVFRYSGPACINASCPEGKLSCGKQSDMREKYSYNN